MHYISKTRQLLHTIPTTTIQHSFGQEISGNHRKGQELSSDARSVIISKFEAGVGISELADEFGSTPKCIRDTIQCWNNHKTTKSLPRKGRPSILTHCKKRRLFCIARKYPKIEYRKLLEEASLLRASKSTAYRALRSYGLSNYRCKRRPKLNRATALLCLKFCQEYRHFNWRRRTVKFSDEYLVARGSGQNSEWCFRYPEEKWRYEMITEKDTSNALIQMVWGSIWITPNGRIGRSPLIIMERDPLAKRNGYTT
jgi:transposase